MSDAWPILFIVALMAATVVILAWASKPPRKVDRGFEPMLPARPGDPDHDSEERSGGR